MELDPENPDFILIRQIDTLHDFWSNQRGDDIQDILSVFPILTNTIKDIKEKGNLKDNKVSLSSIENSFSSFFEKKIGLESIADSIINIDPTDTTENNANLLNNYVNNKALQIIIPHDIDENYDLTYIGEFIRRYMVGDDVSQLIGFVIDANHGKLPQFFKIDQAVKTVINALVVADSANTPKEHSNSHFYERWTPNMFPAEKESSDKAKYTVTSPFFSQDTVNMYYEETEPNSFASDITAFKLIVDKKTDPAILLGETYFSPTTTQGASVDTLKQLIQFVNQNKNMNELNNLDYPAKQLDIRPILRGMKQNNVSINDMINFLLDYKRAGDYEQVNSAKKLREMGKKIIFSTGDELCALYARSQGVPCIYNHSGKMDLYAFEKNPETAEDRKAKYEERRDYYSKYKSFFNIISPERLAYSIEEYLRKIAEVVNDQITAAIVKPFIDYTLAGYRKTLDVEVLKTMNSSLNNILNELEEKIGKLVESDNDFEPKNYKASAEYTANVNKIQMFLNIADKIVEQINNLTENTIEEFIAQEAIKIYESENIIFNHSFDSHALLVNTYNQFTRDTNMESKIKSLVDRKNTADENLRKDMEKEKEVTDTRDLSKLKNKIKNDIGTVEKEGKLLYNAELRYKSMLMTQVQTMNAEIGKILQAYDENMKITNENNKLAVRFTTAYAMFNENYEKETKNIADIVDAYKTFLSDFQERLETLSTASITTRPMTIEAPSTEYFEVEEQMEGGDGDEKTKETIKLWTGLETAILTLSDYSETMYNALYKDFQRDNKGNQMIDFPTYLEYIYSEAYTWKTENDDDIFTTNQREFSIAETKFKTVKTDYIKYINELCGDFNVSVNEIKPTELSILDFHEEISNILKKTGFESMIKLLYFEDSSMSGGDSERKRKASSTSEKKTNKKAKLEEESITLLSLYDITCFVKDNKIKRKFNNFDEVEVNTIMEVETMAGGVGTERKFARAVRTIQKMNKTIKAFENFKKLKEEIIKKEEIKREKTREKWGKIITNPPPASAKSVSPMMDVDSATEVPTSESDSDVSMSEVPDVTNSFNSESSVEVSSEEKMEEGGHKARKNKKRTRKYKDKGNKKTRNRKQKSKNKKTKKLKNRRKHKTRRNL
jgi:hypothetical protein